MSDEKVRASLSVDEMLLAIGSDIRDREETLMQIGYQKDSLARNESVLANLDKQIGARKEALKKRLDESTTT
jgi:hypothetical protein